MSPNVFNFSYSSNEKFHFFRCEFLLSTLKERSIPIYRYSEIHLRVKRNVSFSSKTKVRRDAPHNFRDVTSTVQVGRYDKQRYGQGLMGRRPIRSLSNIPHEWRNKRNVQASRLSGNLSILSQHPPCQWILFARIRS